MRKSCSVAVMRLAALGSILAGCGFEFPPAPGGGDGGGGGGSTDGATSTVVTGSIARDATWSGTVEIGMAGTASTRIEPGVTITVSPGTVVKLRAGASLDIRGSLRVQGTSAQKVRIEPAADNFFALLVSGSTSKLDLSYAIMERGNIQTGAGSSTTIIDTKMSRAAGDLLILNGGSVLVLYSQLGPDPGDLDTSHCNIHTSGSANTIDITRSNITGVPYGLMLYGGLNANLTNNNWYANTVDIDTLPGVSADVSGGWFAGAAPVAGSGATIVKNNLSTARLLDAGVRP